MLNTGQIIADRYELLKQLGRGGFSEVWLAQDKLTDVKVAIKIYAPGMGLDDAGISLFTQEFALVFDMNHTNLLHPTYYDCWERMPYLILPFCKNGSTFKYLTNNSRITETESWHLLHDVAEGLAYLHAKTPPVIHQDIKPDNILINDEGGYMITDFGISARIRSTLRRNQAQESSGGTLAYMGPERFGPSPAPIMASDIWSLGATMYELLTGMPPYGDHGGVLQKNGADIPLINEDFSQELKDIIYKCLALNTWDRPTAKQVADYTNQHINEKNSVEPQPSDIKENIPVQPKKKNNKFIIAVAGIAACIIAILTIYLSTSGGKTEAEPGPIQDTIPAIDYNKLCMSIILEGKSYEALGDTFRYQIDSLKQKNDSVFEDFYIIAMGKYRQADYYKDSVSTTIYKDIKERMSQVEDVLDSAYYVFTELAGTMKKLDQAEASQVFENRAKKIEPYINIDNNENEEVH
ncbi:serine/threonine-protein kinase [Bacteroides sp. GD17]|jgi:serine/threonine protein kinase|uniref:serine/threonine protein kinase n=1 Tax=Bacteroides sp. GD17 TaxID=3139826 RepID=UPI0025EB00F7|nr:serine/threonine-protein kinase [uncultured Bacteroides sp.]